MFVLYELTHRMIVFLCKKEAEKKVRNLNRATENEITMGYYYTSARGRIEIMHPEGHIMPPEGCIMRPEGGIMFPEGCIISIGPRAGVL